MNSQRGTGRTQRMLEEAAAAIRNDESVIIVAASLAAIMDMSPRLMAMPGVAGPKGRFAFTTPDEEYLLNGWAENPRRFEDHAVFEAEVLGLDLSTVAVLGVEWMGQAHPDEGRWHCPCCEWEKRQGHDVAAGCVVDRALMKKTPQDRGAARRGPAHSERGGKDMSDETKDEAIGGAVIVPRAGISKDVLARLSPLAEPEIPGLLVDPHGPTCKVDRALTRVGLVTQEQRGEAREILRKAGRL